MSVVAHALVLWAVLAGAPATSAEVALDPSTRLALAIEAGSFIDVSAFDETAPSELTAPVPPPPAPAAPAPARDFQALPGDQARRVTATALVPRAGHPDRRMPAPDRDEEGAGRRAEDVPWRRDASTLHDRLSDGAERYQPAHTRTTALAAPSSPESIRREPVVGQGDSPRTTRARAGMDSEPTTIDSREPGEVGPMAEPGAPSPAVVVTPGPPADRPGGAASTAEGPLDAKRGMTAFDVAPGWLVRDGRTSRAASGESHPSITDLSLAASPGEGVRSRGVSADAPGAVAHPSVGTAPALSGEGGPAGGRGDAAADARARVYARYKLDIQARVSGVLDRVWPRKLAVRLEQGETLVTFVVRPDGHLAGPVRVTKSAGFEEFDSAALEAIRLVTPFPPIPRAGAKSDQVLPLPVSLRVTFSNPVIR